MIDVFVTCTRCGTRLAADATECPVCDKPPPPISVCAGCGKTIEVGSKVVSGNFHAECLDQRCKDIGTGLFEPADLPLPPRDILEHAVALENWFKQNGCRSWQLCGVCSRDHAYGLERTISFLRRAIHEYDQWVEANRK